MGLFYNVPEPTRGPLSIWLVPHSVRRIPFFPSTSLLSCSFHSSFPCFSTLSPVASLPCPYHEIQLVVREFCKLSTGSESVMCRDPSVVPITLPSRRGAKYCDEHAYMSAFLSFWSHFLVCLKNRKSTFHQIFFALCLWLWLNPSLAELQYVMYFCFVDNFNDCPWHWIVTEWVSSFADHGTLAGTFCQSYSSTCKWIVLNDVCLFLRLICTCRDKGSDFLCCFYSSFLLAHSHW